MMTILTLAGISISIIVFLNLLSTKDSLRRPRPDNAQNREPARVDPRKFLKQDNQGRRLRVCPLCGTVLNTDEFLFAAISPETGDGRKRQAQIYGCRYCYATEGINLEKSSISHLEM